MHDSGERKTDNTGAQTDPSHANAAMELLSPYSLWQLSTWLGKGAEKYAPRNWEKGIPFSICVGKLQRHLAEYMMGKTNEPHLDAVGFWWHALTHYQRMIELGKLPASLNDLPMYEKQEKFVCPVGWKIELTSLKSGWTIWNQQHTMFLWKDLTTHHQTTGYLKFIKDYERKPNFGEALGYWPTKEEAEDALRRYLEKEKC